MIIDLIRTLHDGFFGTLERLTRGWFLGLAARFVFAGVLMIYYLHSASLKVGSGFIGFFQPSFSAYIQILTEQVMVNYDLEIANVPLYLKLVVYMGTYAEFLLPILIVIGMFTRVAAFGMIIFILVQSYVDINFLGVDAATIGALFDRDPSSAIVDQRTLWIFVLLVLVIKGAGTISVDRILSGLFPRHSHSA
ncbi:MAG: DoxX family protein [Rhizobiaceae bacterium]